MGEQLPARRRTWPVVALLGAFAALQVVLAVLSLALTSAVRSYVIGESLYSKGQKDAQIRLLEYVESGRELDYREFVAAIAVPRGDCQAREALDLPVPDLAMARRGFLAGGNRPEDVGGLIWLYRGFSNTRLMADAIDTWREGDEAIRTMMALAEVAHRARDEGAAGSLPELRAEATRINDRLTRLERRFSAQLAAASTTIQQGLVATNIAVAILLGLIGLGIVRQRLRERELAAREIADRERRLQQLLESAAEGLFGVDADGRCTFINRSALDMLGYQRADEVVGQAMHDVLHPRCAAAAAADDDAGAEPIRRACPVDRDLRPISETHVSGELFRGRRGAPFPVEYWSHPMPTDGAQGGAVVTFFDIGERLRTQEALRQSEARLARLVDTVADAVISMDIAGRIVFFNRAAERIFRCDAADCAGSAFATFVARPSREAISAMLAEVAGASSAEDLPRTGVRELVCRRGDGEEFHAEATLSRQGVDHGGLLTMVLRDISEQNVARRDRAAREASEIASREKSIFLSRMSHELRTPLNAVLGFARLLAMDGDQKLSPEDLARVRHIESAGRHVLGLVDDVLDLSMVEAGRLALSMAPIDAQAVAGEALAVVATQAEGAGVVIDEPGPRAPHEDATGARLPLCAQADRLRLRQVLINLLGNAIKYSLPGGHVRLSIEASGDICRFVVADSGMGMSQEQLAHLFEPFNRLGADRTGVEGRGIGLALTRQLVDLMGGTLVIESAPGQGTSATVQLPRANVGATKDAPAAAGDAGFAGPLDVLYAEDNEVNIELLRQFARLCPAVSFRSAISGAEALRIAQQRPPDLMLVDMDLGDTSGMQLAKLLRQDPATARVHLVALSADAMPVQVREALDGGFEDYLIKPIDFDEIRRVFAHYSRRRHSAQHRAAQDALLHGAA